MRRESGTETKVTRAMRAGFRLVLFVAVWPSVAPGQAPGPEDQAIDQVRQLPTIGGSDQQRIQDWVLTQIGKFTDFNTFRKRFRDSFVHANNSQQFPAALATQTATVVAAQVAGLDLNPELAKALAQTLCDMRAPETHSGLIELLKSKHVATRYLAAKGLSTRTLSRSIAADSAKLTQTVNALRDAGITELDSVVLGRIYQALSYPGKASAVFDAYIAVMDKRLPARRLPGIPSDGAERFAYVFFSEKGVIAALNAAQKSALGSRLAVLLRLDGERYNTLDLEFDETDRLDRTLWAAEEILVDSGMVGDKGGKIRKAIQAGGHENRAAVLEEVYKWVGHPTSGVQGALNAAPWNVPVGAP